MSALTCARCGTSAPETFLACPRCHALFHAARLEALAAEADGLEQRGELLQALERLRAMPPLLPAASTQAAAIRARIAALEPRAGGTPAAPSSAPKWVAGLGVGGLLAWKLAGPALALLGKGKLLFAGLLKLPTLLSFFVSAAFFSGGTGGPGLALVVLGSFYVHEMGHTWAFHRYGIAVSAAMFVPGFGAFVRGSHYPQNPAAVGDVALSGPVWGAFSGLAVLAAGWALHVPWVVGAAVLIAEVNLFNLVPVWQLDGARAVSVLSRRQVVTLGVVGLAAAAVAASPLGAVSAVGLLVRRFVRAPSGEGDRTTFWLFVELLLGLMALRLGAQLVMERAFAQP